MADGALSIKLRCASWQQLATIYKRDLSHGSMFLKAVTPPAVGTAVHIGLTLPSATVIVLTGVVQTHVQDPQRGAGVELALDPIPASSVWLIESALASEHKRLATPVHGVPVLGAPQRAGPGHATPAIPAIHDSADLTGAERDLIKALIAEAESLKTLNPFLVLGVGYEATNAEVRAAFGDLTKRYHPDRFARYGSAELREVAAEIFILIRDAYRRVGDAASRLQVLQSLGKPAAAPRAVPAPPRLPAPVSPPRTAQRTGAGSPSRHAPTGPITPITGQTGPIAMIPPAPAPAPPTAFRRAAVNQAMPPPTGDPVDVTAVEALIDQGRLDEALSAYKLLVKKYPHDRNVRAGVELCEGLMALAVRDRVDAAQRFESALEIDPSNERAARELADMRRQATHERKGLLSRLMGKKEP